jgi:rfaE bifunctional protein kinase chain/domain
MIDNKRLDEIKSKMVGKNIVVIGDLMLDAYYWGGVSRISPEAPVPVVEIDNEFFRFGGAANVANNIVHLGANPIPIGIIGADQHGEIFKDLMKKEGITSEAIFEVGERPTTTKVRVIADNQHIVRIDKEVKSDIDIATEERIMSFLKNKVDSIDGIILQDYNKGVLTKSLIAKVSDFAKRNGILITVDPKFKNFFQYQNVTLFKPNRSETEQAYGIKIENEEDLKKAGQRLLTDLNAESVLLTLSEDGIALFENGKPDYKKVPTKARKVADVSGAGDTVISTLTLALAAGGNLVESAYLANFAGGIVCEEVGIVPIETEKLFSSVRKEINE